jgi:Domain of unknown function (DUF5666)
MSIRKIGVLALSVLAIGVIAAPAAAQAAHFQGTVTAKNRDARTFTLRQDEGGGTFKIKVTKRTKFERLAGFGAIKVGDRNIEAVAFKNANGRWIARKVERSGQSGGGGDASGGRIDDGPRHGGNDDGPNHT